MKRSALGFGPVLLVVACLLGLWTLAPDLGYALAGPAQDLGRPADPALLRNNVHATIHGQVELAGTATYRGEERPLALLADAPVAVLEVPGNRPAKDTVDATGRLLRADRMGSLLGGNPWTAVAAKKNLPPDRLFVLIEGAEPGPPWHALGWAALFFALLGFNVWRLTVLRRRLAEASK